MWLVCEKDSAAGSVVTCSARFVVSTRTNTVFMKLLACLDLRIDQLEEVQLRD